eukprot:1195372-Prorocentrum_minimum.AAC.10
MPGAAISPIAERPSHLGWKGLAGGGGGEGEEGGGGRGGGGGEGGGRALHQQQPPHAHRTARHLSVRLHQQGLEHQPQCVAHKGDRPSCKGGGRTGHILAEGASGRGESICKRRGWICNEGDRPPKRGTRDTLWLSTSTETSSRWCMAHEIR